MLCTSRGDFIDVETQFLGMDGPTGHIVCRAGTLVMGINGTRHYGCFQKLRQDQHSQIEGKLSELFAWSTECYAAGLSAGSYFSIEGEGVYKWS